MAKITPNLIIGAASRNFVIKFKQGTNTPNFTGATVNLLVQPVTLAGTTVGASSRYPCAVVNNVPQYATTGSDLFATPGWYTCQLEYINTGEHYTSSPSVNVYIQVLANLA